jgi:hypothetical protein
MRKARLVARTPEHGVSAVSVLNGARRVEAVVTNADLSLRATHLDGEMPPLWTTSRRSG